MPFAVKMILDSIAPCASRLRTLQVTYPRYIHDELLTHRDLSRNSRSSRAVPVEMMLEEVQKDPVVPEHWGAAQKGMQARNEILPGFVPQCRDEWLRARDAAVKQATRLLNLGLHKQVINYLLMPFTWITVVVSATRWSNFLVLRCHKDAHPTFQKLATMMRAVMAASEPHFLKAGEWHLPYSLPDEALLPLTDRKGYSTARCARVSFKPFDPEMKEPAQWRSEDSRLYRQLQDGAGDGLGHWSPFEHTAEALATLERSGNFTGFKQHRKEFPTEVVEEDTEYTKAIWRLHHA